MIGPLAPLGQPADPRNAPPDHLEVCFERRDGKRRLYRADHERLGPLKQFLESFWAGQLDRLAILAEEAERG